MIGYNRSSRIRLVHNACRTVPLSENSPDGFSEFLTRQFFFLQTDSKRYVQWISVVIMIDGRVKRNRQLHRKLHYELQSLAAFAMRKDS